MTIRCHLLLTKLDAYKIKKFLNCHSTTLFIRWLNQVRPRYYIVDSTLKNYLKNVLKIFFVQPTRSRAPMNDRLFDQLDKHKKFNELTYENLKYVKTTINEEI